MILSDAIVWWRAYILWRTRSVLSLGCVLVGVALGQAFNPFLCLCDILTDPINSTGYCRSCS